MLPTVLIVDAERESLSQMDTTLTAEGFRVITSNSGHGAHALARQEKPDLIILNWALPDMNGYEFLRRHNQKERTPIILLAAAAGIDVRVRCLELGADDFVTKPVGLRELTWRVRAVLRRVARITPQDEPLQTLEPLHEPDYHFALA